MCFCIVAHHLIFEPYLPKFIFLPVSAFFAFASLLSVELPPVILNCEMPVLQGWILIFNGVIPLIAPAYFERMHPLLLCLLLFRPLLITVGLGFMFLGFPAVIEGFGGIHSRITGGSILLSIVCRVMIVELDYVSGIPSALMLLFGVAGSIGFLWYIVSDKPVGTRIHGLFFVILGSALNVVGYASLHGLLNAYPYFTRPFFVPTAYAVGVFLIFCGFVQLQPEYYKFLPVFIEFGAFVCGGLLYLMTEWYPLLYVVIIPFGAFCHDMVLFNKARTKTITDRRVITEYWKQQFVTSIVSLLALVSSIIFEAQYGPEHPIIHALGICGYFGTVVFVTLVIFGKALHHVLPRDEQSRRFLLHGACNLVLAVFVPKFYFFFNFVGLFAVIIFLGSLHTNWAPFLNMMLGWICLLGSFFPVYYELYPWFVPFALEVAGELALCVGMFCLAEGYHAKDLKPIVVLSYLFGFVFLLLSSFPSPSNGYLIFLMGFFFNCGAFALAQQRKSAIKQTEHGQIGLARIGLVLAGCTLMLVSPTFENMLLFVAGLGTTLFPLTRLLLTQKAVNCFLALTLTMVLILTGVMLQSKLVVMLGGFYVFLGINILASVIFPASILFPFVLTFCGFAFIYAGMKFDNDTFMDMFKIEQFGVNSNGMVDEWTRTMIESIGPKKSVPSVA